MGKFSNNIQRVTLILALGQSNEDGRAIDSDLNAPYRTAITDANIYQKSTNSSADNGTWQTLEYNENNVWQVTPSSPLNSPASTALHGSELFLGYDYVADKGKPIYMIKQGVGGTNIHGLSQTTWNDALVPDLLTRYIDWLSDVAIPKIVALGHYVDFQGVFWFQGFSDSDTAAHANAYEVNLTEILNTRLRAGLAKFGDAFENVTIYIQESPDWGAVGGRPQAPNDTVRAAQLAVGSLTNFVFLPNTNYITSLQGDNTHLTSAGEQAVSAQRLAVLT